MKSTLMRFATDFTKLADYFGPDDYEKNINIFENLNKNLSKSPEAFGEKGKDEEKIKNKQSINYFK